MPDETMTCPFRFAGDIPCRLPAGHEGIHEATPQGQFYEDWRQQVQTRLIEFRGNYAWRQSHPAYGGMLPENEAWLLDGMSFTLSRLDEERTARQAAEERAERLKGLLAPGWETALGLTGEDAAAVAEIREGIECRWREMPETVRALPPKLRAAWLVGDVEWSGEYLKDREPVAKVKPGMSVSDLIINQRRGAPSAWVPCAARLPAEGQEVLVWSSKRQACFVGYRVRGVEIPWFWRRAGASHSFISCGYGTHWQELPPGPGSEEEEKP